MKHYCGECGQTVKRDQGEPYLPCSHDYVENVVTERWCPECEDHRLPEDTPKRNHWKCPDCEAVVEFV